MSKKELTNKEKVALNKNIRLNYAGSSQKHLLEKKKSNNFF